MKTCILMLICLLGVSAFGQETQSEWQKFSSILEEFTLEAPNSIVPRFGNMDVKDIKSARFYGTSADGTYYFAFSDNHEELALSKAAFDLAGNFADRNLEKVIFSFPDRFGYYQRILMVKTGNPGLHLPDGQ